MYFGQLAVGTRWWLIKTNSRKQCSAVLSLEKGVRDGVWCAAHVDYLAAMRTFPLDHQQLVLLVSACSPIDEVKSTMPFTNPTVLYCVFGMDRESLHRRGLSGGGGQGSA